jgi:hypothetical protein
LAVEFSGRRFEWTFLLAKVNFAILGADFFKHFNLIVDLAANQIVDTEGHSLKTLIRTLLLLGSLRRAAALTVFTVFRHQRLLLPCLTATMTRTLDEKTVRSRFAVSPLPCVCYEQNKQQRLSGNYFAGMPHSILTNNCSLTSNVAFIFNRLNTQQK